MDCIAASGNDGEHGARRVALAFNEAINGRDLETLEGSMSAGHIFVDSEGNIISGRNRVAT